jgi:hypothetical protein
VPRHGTMTAREISTGARELPPGPAWARRRSTVGHLDTRRSVWASVRPGRETSRQFCHGVAGRGGRTRGSDAMTPRTPREGPTRGTSLVARLAGCRCRSGDGGPEDQAGAFRGSMAVAGASRGHEFAPQIELHPFGIDGAERAEQNAPQRGSAVGADRDAKVSVTLAILRTRLRRASADSGERVVRVPTGCAHRAARARSLAVERRVEAKLHGVHQAHRRIAPRDAHAARSVGANAERPGGRGHRSAGRPSARVTSTRGASQTIASTGSSSRHPQQHRRRIRVLSPQEGPSAAGRAFAVEATARRVRRFSTLRGVAMTLPLPSRTRPSCANPSRRCP